MRPTLRARRALFALALASIGAGSVSAETPLERGRYLARSISACGNCHTEQGPKGPVAGKELAGTFMGEDALGKIWSANITPDKATGIGRWTDAQIATLIREGRRPDGTLIGPMMPMGQYRGISDRDLAALVAYVRSVKPVKNQVPKPEYKIPLPPNYGPPVGSVPEVARSDKVAWGRYLAGPLGHCIECHSAPDKTGAPDTVNQLGAGGLTFDGPWGRSIAANITPTNLQRYSDAELKKIITTGVRPDGSKLKVLDDLERAIA